MNALLGLLASGQAEDARRMLAHLVATQHRDAHWCQNFYPDGAAFRKGVQFDEVAFPMLLAGRLREAGALGGDPGVRAGLAPMVRRASSSGTCR